MKRRSRLKLLEQHQILALIGIFTAGKTKIGSRLAADLGWTFVDIDDCIVREFGAKDLQSVVNALTLKEFAALEERVALETLEGVSSQTIIGTGGSIIYYRKVMRALRKLAYVIHLNPSLEAVKRRVARHPDRGIVFLPGQTVDDVYNYRLPEYPKWADETIDTSHDRPGIAKALAVRIRRHDLSGLAM